MTPLKCPAVGRDNQAIHALQFYFSRRVTDDEMRFLHEVMQRAVACMPPPDDYGGGPTSESLRSGEPNP